MFKELGSFLYSRRAVRDYIFSADILYYFTELNTATFIDTVGINPSEL
jgi:hypothetical protein